MYWQLAILGFTVAAALCTYYITSQAENVPQQNQPKPKERKKTQERRHTKLLRASKPGDQCFWCTNALSVEDWNILRCRHALHKDCYTDFIRMDKKCLICQSTDPCVICFNNDKPLTEENATYLSCCHALHTDCLAKYVENGFEICPLCRKTI